MSNAVAALVPITTSKGIAGSDNDETKVYVLSPIVTVSPELGIVPSLVNTDSAWTPGTILPIRVRTPVAFVFVPPDILIFFGF